MIYYWISLQYATFTIIVKDDKVVEAAPIAKWAKGHELEHVLNYYRNRGAKIVQLK